MFDIDQQVRNFLELKEEFESIQVDQQNIFAETKANNEVVQLKNNCIPKGMIPLEKLFDHNDVAKNHNMKSDDEDWSLSKSLFYLLKLIFSLCYPLNITVFPKHLCDVFHNFCKVRNVSVHKIHFA